MIWGLIHGLFLVIERLGLGRLLERVWAPLAHTYVLAVVLVGWVFFRIEDFPDAAGYLAAMIGLGDAPLLAGLGGMADPYTLTVFVIGAVVAVLPERIGMLGSSARRGRLMSLFESLTVRSVTLLATTVVSLSLIASYSHKAFIYFRF